jgi:serine/threonine protein kinase
MAVNVEGFLKHLGDCGLLSSDDVLALRTKIPPEQHAEDAQSLAKELVRQKRLTLFQANALYHGKPQGLILGNYVMLDKIGSGAMGMVFKAEHRRMKRVVAVKVLPPTSMKDTDVVRRFHREVEAAAKLSHPNIVAAHDADDHKGIHFLVMEYVDGQDLARHVEEHGTMAVEAALDCVLQAARGLEHAHERGVVHRDIKPANLLMDKSGVVKVLDMGLARLCEPAGATAETDIAQVTALTQCGNIMGTVDFMSPEQAIDSRSVDAFSDIYSLGCTLYFLLVGKSVYDGETVMARIFAHRDAPIPSIRHTRADVPLQIDAIFQKMVAKTKADRYPSMTEVIQDLGNWRNLTVVTAAPTHTLPGKPGSDNSIQKNVMNAIFDD